MEMGIWDIKSAQGRSLCIVLSQLITVCSWSILVSCKSTLLWTQRCHCRVAFIIGCCSLTPVIEHPIQSSILAREWAC